MKQALEDKIAAENLRSRLLEYRAKFGIKQSEFAKLAKLDRSTIVKAENKKHISAISQIKILSVINHNIL